MTERTRLIQRARAIRRDIAQIFADAASWNDYAVARAEGAARIDPDPDGALQRAADHLDRWLRAVDPAHG